MTTHIETATLRQRIIAAEKPAKDLADNSLQSAINRLKKSKDNPKRLGELQREFKRRVFKGEWGDKNKRYQKKLAEGPKLSKPDSKFWSSKPDRYGDVHAQKTVPLSHTMKVGKNEISIKKGHLKAVKEADGNTYGGLDLYIGGIKNAGDLYDRGSSAFLSGLKKHLREKGFPAKALKDLNFSESGMQGSGHVNLDVNADFVKHWESLK